MRIHPRRGFVEEEHIGPADEGGGQSDPLPLATGKSTHDRAGEVINAQTSAEG